MCPSFQSEQDALAALIGAIRNLGQCSSDEPERHACINWERRLLEFPLLAAEQVVKQLRDELEHYKSNFNDSFDMRDETLNLRQRARDIAKQVVNFYVLRRRPDLAAVIKGTKA